MGDGNHVYGIIRDPVDETERKLLKDIAPCGALIAGPALRGFRHTQDRMVKIGKKGLRRCGAARMIPPESALGFLLGLRVKTNVTRLHAGALSPGPRQRASPCRGQVHGCAARFPHARPRPRHRRRSARGFPAVTRPASPARRIELHGLCIQFGRGCDVFHRVSIPQNRQETQASERRAPCVVRGSDTAQTKPNDRVTYLCLQHETSGISRRHCYGSTHFG